MKPITTLTDRSAAFARTVLPMELKDLYGGDLHFTVRVDRPYVIGNFVSTLDGVVTLRGQVESQAQIDTATRIAREIEGVSNVDTSGLSVAAAAAD